MSRRKKPPRATPGAAPFDAVRHGYAALGPEAYYREHGAGYRNPHEATVAAGLRELALAGALDLSRVLDLACGSGEATQALREFAGTIDACDPFTGEAYRERTGSEAFPWSFSDVADGVLEGRRYSLVVCSFALHLCERSRLPLVVQALSQATDALLIVTPHKRPELRSEWGFELVEERLRERVRLRVYRTQS